MHDNLSFKRENIRFEENKSLSGLTFFSSRGKAKFYTEPETVRELREAILIAKEKGLKITVIGSGTHTILPDLALNGLLLSTRKLKGMTIKGSLITAMAGESLDSVINTAIEHNLMGLEEFGGIPGTIAAAIKINATSQGKNIGEYHFYTDTMTFDGRIHRKPDYLDFFNSNKTIIDEDEIILSTTLRLKEGKRTAEARIRKERFIELMFVPPCKNFIGNVFKDGDDYKAGDLIKKAGMTGDKGLRCEFSSFQSNCLFAYPDCTENDVRTLIHMATERVYQMFSIRLRLSVSIASE